mgnify:CR=1 FL=1|jgi:hypothetical protein
MISIPKKFRTPLLASIIWIAFFCLYLFTAPSALPEGDEAILLGVADRVARYGFSWLPPNLNHNHEYSSYGFFASGFSKYGLGQSLLAIPITEAFLVAKESSDWETFTNAMFVVFTLPAAITASINSLFFLICLKLGRRIDTAFVLTLILGTTTMIWPYSQTLFSDPTLAASWLLALYSFLSYRESKNYLWLAIAGAVIGFAILNKIVATYTVPIFGIYFLHLLGLLPFQKENRKPFFSKESIFPFFCCVIPFALMIICVLYYNNIRYGKWFSFGYTDYGTYDMRDTVFGFNVPFLAGLYAQLLSSGKGFFFYNPSCLLAFIGWNDSYKKNKPEALLCAGILGGSLAIYSTWYGWHGDWSWGLRYWSCMPPFFLILAGPFFDKLISKTRDSIFGYWKQASFTAALLIISLGVQIPGIAIKSNNYILTASNVEVFKGKFFTSEWPIRDDSLQLHFIPEFSPIAGHLWMMKMIFYRNSPRYSEIYSNPPWASLNSLWRLDSINPSYFRYNIWWMNVWVNNSPNSFGMFVKAGFLFLVFLSLTICGLRQTFKIEGENKFQ